MDSDPSVERLLEELGQAELPDPGKRRAIRREANASLRDVAHVLGVDPMTVSRWERGANPRRPRAIAYRRLLEALDRRVS